MTGLLRRWRRRQRDRDPERIRDPEPEADPLHDERSEARYVRDDVRRMGKPWPHEPPEHPSEL